VQAVPGVGVVRVNRIQCDRRGAPGERATLDERSDTLAASLLQPLNTAQRARLGAAMTEVGRLLTNDACA
jgi:hypothetical protein